MTGRRIEVSKEKPVIPVDQPAPVLDWIPISRLVIDDAYQREIGYRGWAAIRKIATEFRWSRFSPVLVAPIESGFFAIVDGQHRAHAAAICGFESIPAMMVQMTRTEQASAFSFVNGNVTRITPFHVYKAALAAGEGWAERCQAIVESAGCRLMTSNTSTKSKKAGQVFAIGRVRNAVARGDGEVLRIALKTMREADQDGNPLLYGDTVLGVWMEVILARPAIPEKTLAEFLRARSIVRTIDTADELSRQPEFLGRMKSDLRRDAVKTLLDDFVKRRAA